MSSARRPPGLEDKQRGRFYFGLVMSDSGIDGISLAIGGGAVGAFCSLLGAWIRARFSKTKIEPQPLEVKGATQYVTCEQCGFHREVFHQRLAREEAAMQRVEDKLDNLRCEDEERAKRLHDRLDPVVSAVVANQELLREHLKEFRARERK